MNKDLVRHPGRRSYVEDNLTWYDAAVGERIAIRLSSLDTNGKYAVVESIAAPGSSVPRHIHKNEEEHFVILEGTYRFACGDRTFDAAPGTSLTVPKGVPHAWRNISDQPGRLLCTFTPGGFELLVEEVTKVPADKVLELAARRGCLIVGPPIEA
jgi:mannose-6-phosphate isomerase-like protein (cupin superfamily)